MSMIENFENFAVNHSPAAPRELLAQHAPDEALEICRRLVRKYGEFLQWWPVIYDLAGKLRQEGIRLARPV